MQITKIKKGKKRYNIYIDGEFSLAAGDETLLKLDLFNGKEIDEKELCKIITYEGGVRARDYALNLLSYRPRTKRELLRRLKQKKYDVRTAEETVSKLERSGLINDYSFAKLFIETFRDRRGIYRLKNDLFKHGVEKTIIEKVLKEVPVNENKTAKKLINKWLQTHKKRDEKVKRRLLNYLVQRGISWDTISELRNYIKTIISETD